MGNSYAIIYFGPREGGFAKRMDLLTEVLREMGAVRRVHSAGELWRFLRTRQPPDTRLSVLVYSSLMAPLVAILRLFRRPVRFYYMVRGDEVTWAEHRGRNLRAMAAVVLQKLMAVLGCCFVFASEDLRELFARRLGNAARYEVLPNTLGKSLPEVRAFDGQVAVVGDFGTVKNIEHVIDALDGGEFTVDLYGNRSLPKRYQRSRVRAHGVVPNLKSHLRNSSLLVLSSISEGFPNVLLDALEVGCGVVVHDEFPFRKLPITDRWRFALEPGRSRGVTDLRTVLRRLRDEDRDFGADNRELVSLVESNWGGRVLGVFA
jgi:glycosyltransferase involved in cell wall biosynthesis